MRPPDLPGGNFKHATKVRPNPRCFNEAAGFTRRKPERGRALPDRAGPRFNEAAGFTRRKPGTWT